MTRRGDKVSAFDALEGLGQVSDLMAFSEPAGEGPGVVSLPLQELLPDPVQARRILPAALRGRFFAGELTAVQALKAWQQLATEDDTEAEVLEARVVRLARSLQAQEQINPITVNKVVIGDRERYMIETGERRWWAHWWLVGIEGDLRFEMIHSVVVEQASPWRQAAENLQGEPLSAVQEACQVARLLLLESGIEMAYALTWTEAGPAVESDLGGAGYDFYRQAREQRVPQGAWPLIEQATGKGVRYCQYLLGLLRLSDEVLEAADRAGLTESQLRPLASGEADPERQLRIARLVIEYELGRDQAAGLVRTADLDEAERKLADRQAKTRRTPTIRAPEQIVLERLTAMTRLMDRVSRSEPSMLQVVAHKVVQEGEVDKRRAELQSLHSFLTSLLQLLEGASQVEE